MGLDMYLYAKRFVWSTEKVTQEKVKSALPCPFSDELKEVSYKAMYWRKANAIHNWFVQNVQEGNDDCRTYWVSTDQLTTLRNLCNTVLEVAKTIPGKVKVCEMMTQDGWESVYEDGIVVQNPDEINSLLPTEGGFFFGSTAYDQYYIDEIKRTKEGLDKILNSDHKGWDFEYHASW